MVTEDTSGQSLENPEQSAPETPPVPPSEETPKEWRLSIRMDKDQIERITAFANYAARRNLIPNNPRGNLTAWVNYCLDFVQEQMRQQVFQERGVK